MKTTLHLGLVVALSTTALEAKAVEVRPGGRLHLGYVFHDSDARPLDDDFIVRRARFGLDGKINDDWSFELVYDFADDGELKDAYLRYQGWRPGAFTIGQFKVPFGLEESSSSSNITFTERSLPGSAFVQSRRMGIGFDRNGSNHTFEVMGFGPSVDGNEGRGVGARFTFTPIDAVGTVVHLGMAATAERPRNEVRFNPSPESRPTDISLVNTGDLVDASRVDQLGLEAAWKNGPLSAQMEWMHSHVSRDSGSPDADFHGWYVAGSWILTGESRGYRGGVFRGISTSKPGGAWELSTRFSHIDLDDGEVRGGSEDNLTLGLNWYANEHLRILANYIKVRSERGGVSDDPSIVLVRAQIEF